MIHQPPDKAPRASATTAAIRHLALLCLALCSLNGCAGESRHVLDDGQTSNRARNHSLRIDGLRLVSHDLDRDGRDDQLDYFDATSGRRVRTERDLDFDGQIDLYEHYDDRGALIEEEMRLDLDPHIDVVRIYQDEVVIRRELTLGFDGRLALIKHYDSNGAVLRIERDSDSDGRVDTFEYFEGGEVVRIGRDRDGDGSPEDIERLSL